MKNRLISLLKDILIVFIPLILCTSAIDLFFIVFDYFTSRFVSIVDYVDFYRYKVIFCLSVFLGGLLNWGRR